MEDSTYILYFYLPIMIWLALVVIVFGALMYKYPFGNWTKENPNPYARETLGLPRGIFRAILTLSLLFAVIILELAFVKLGRPESWMSEFMVAFQMMIAFYFGSKVMHHVASNDRKKVTERAHQAVEVAKVGGVIGGSYSSAPSAPAGKPEANDFYDPESAG